MQLAKLINVYIVPLLVVAAGLIFILWRRMKANLVPGTSVQADTPMETPADTTAAMLAETSAAQAVETAADKAAAIPAEKPAETEE